MLQRTNPVGFDEAEMAYLMNRRIGRLATVSPEQQPHVVPIGYEFDGHYFYFCGWNLEKSLKFRHLQWNHRVALVVDDLAPGDRFAPRGIEIRGLAESGREQGHAYVRITPLRKVSWGL